MMVYGTAPITGWQKACQKLKASSKEGQCAGCGIAWGAEEMGDCGALTMSVRRPASAMCLMQPYRQGMQPPRRSRSSALSVDKAARGFVGICGKHIR
jgi:hypothetical protein